MISLKNPSQIAKMRDAGKILREVEDAVRDAIRPGVSTMELDELAEHPDCVRLIITDDGKAFDPLALRDPDTTLRAEDRAIGGLGILLVQSLMDSINYERIDGKNVLTIKKNLQ